MLVNILYKIYLVMFSVGYIKPPVTGLGDAERRYNNKKSLNSDNNYLSRSVSSWMVRFDHRVVNGYVNLDLRMPLTFVLTELELTGLIEEITDFNGCYNPRGIRGREDIASIHAYGLGCDFNFKSGKPFSRSFINVWEKYGFYNGGEFNDPGHFSYVTSGSDWK